MEEDDNSVTMVDVLKEQEAFEEDAAAVLGASDDKNCTYPMGYIKRQALYACLTCCPESVDDPSLRSGVCLACSLSCHEKHTFVELYTKRNFRCDCGGPKFKSKPCSFGGQKSEPNTLNQYNQNFSGLYCVCHRPYPDPDATLPDDEMIQCIVCEDWLHSQHLDSKLPPPDRYSEMICQNCMASNDFLNDYLCYAVSNENNTDHDTSSELNVTDNAQENVANNELSDAVSATINPTDSQQLGNVAISNSKLNAAEGQTGHETEISSVLTSDMLESISSTPSGNQDGELVAKPQTEENNQNGILAVKACEMDKAVVVDEAMEVDTLPAVDTLTAENLDVLTQTVDETQNDSGKAVIAESEQNSDTNVVGNNITPETDVQTQLIAIDTVQNAVDEILQVQDKTLELAMETDESTAEIASGGITELDVALEKSSNITEPDVDIEKSSDITEPDAAIQKNNDIIEPDVAAEKSTDITEANIGIEKSTDITEADVGIENSSEITELDSAIEKSTDITEPDVAIEKSTNMTVLIEKSTDITELDVAFEKSTDITEPDVSIEKSTDITEPDVSIEKTTDITEPETVIETDSITDIKIDSVKVIDGNETKIVIDTNIEIVPEKHIENGISTVSGQNKDIPEDIDVNVTSKPTIDTILTEDVSSGLVESGKTIESELKENSHIDLGTSETTSLHCVESDESEIPNSDNVKVSEIAESDVVVTDGEESDKMNEVTANDNAGKECYVDDSKIENETDLPLEDGVPITNKTDVASSEMQSAATNDINSTSEVVHPKDSVMEPLEDNKPNDITCGTEESLISNDIQMSDSVKTKSMDTQLESVIEKPLTEDTVVSSNEESQLSTTKNNENGITLDSSMTPTSKDIEKIQENERSAKDVTDNPSIKDNEPNCERIDKKRKLEHENVTLNDAAKKIKREIMECIRPSSCLRHNHKGAAFWPSDWRSKLCSCPTCLDMYSERKVSFLIDVEDTITAYEDLGKIKTESSSSQYEKGMDALSSLGHVQQINAITEYNRMKEKLLDFLKTFKDKKEVVKEEDIKGFFAGMKPKREPDGVYFCQ